MTTRKKKKKIVSRSYHRGDVSEKRTGLGIKKMDILDPPEPAPAFCWNMLARKCQKTEKKTSKKPPHKNKKPKKKKETPKQEKKREEKGYR